MADSGTAEHSTANTERYETYRETGKAKLYFRKSISNLLQFNLLILLEFTRKIYYNRITTGFPRSNGQVERINHVIIPASTKMSIADPGKWYQQTLNSTLYRSIGMTPFRLLNGVEIHHHEDVQLKEILETECQRQLEDSRNDLHHQAKLRISKVQEENRKTYNLRRQAPLKYLYTYMLRCGHSGHYSILALSVAKI